MDLLNSIPSSAFQSVQVHIWGKAASAHHFKMRQNILFQCFNVSGFHIADACQRCTLKSLKSYIIRGKFYFVQFGFASNAGYINHLLIRNLGCKMQHNTHFLFPQICNKLLFLIILPCKHHICNFVDTISSPKFDTQKTHDFKIEQKVGLYFSPKEIAIKVSAACRMVCTTGEKEIDGLCNCRKKGMVCASHPDGAKGPLLNLAAW